MHIACHMSYGSALIDLCTSASERQTQKQKFLCARSILISSAYQAANEEECGTHFATASRICLIIFKSHSVDTE